MVAAGSCKTWFYLLIFTAAMTDNPSGPTGSGRRPSGSVAQPPPTAAMNHLLLGKKPIVTSKPRRGPPPGSIPEPRIRAAVNSKSSVSRTPNQPGASSLSEDGRQRTSSGSSSRSSIKATQWSRPQVGFKTNQIYPIKIQYSSQITQKLYLFLFSSLISLSYFLFFLRLSRRSFRHLP